MRRASQLAPTVFLEHVSDFWRWAESGMPNPKLQLLPMTIPILSNSPRAILDTILSTTSFLTWCESHNLVSLAAIDARVFADYQRSLFWQYECEDCHTRVAFEPGRLIESCANKECKAKQSYRLTGRVTRKFVQWQSSHLRVFFNWAQLHGLVVDNPVAHEMCKINSRTFTAVDGRGKYTEMGDAIRRYDDMVIERLCAYIVSPDTDPEEALILYLIIFHLCTVAETCSLGIPSQVKCGPGQTPASSAEDYQYLFLPRSAMTRGRLKPRRAQTKLVFPRKALSWLVPLLERHYERRNQLVSAEHHSYLLAVKWRARHNTPVTH